MAVKDIGQLVAIVQARMGSSRLPGKVLMPILERPMLLHITDRLQLVPRIDAVVVATSNKPGDDEIETVCTDAGVTCFRGSEKDVLDRFYKAAQNVGAETVIRVTADCPLTDPGIMTKLTDYYQAGDNDFCGIATGAGVAQEDIIGRFPDGLDGEIFSMGILTITREEATLPLHREHVTPFIWSQPERFRIGTLKPQIGDFSRMRWTVDNQADLGLIRWIYAELYEQNAGFEMHDVLDLLSLHPAKAKSNAHFISQEGYEQFWN